MNRRTRPRTSKPPQQRRCHQAAAEGEQRQAVVNYILTHSGQISKDTPKELQNYDTYVKIVLLKADTRYADWSAQEPVCRE